MDLGEPFKRGMRIVPAEEGSFIVRVGTDTFGDGQPSGPVVGFTTIDDLLIWMARHGSKLSPKQPGVTDLMEDDVVKPAYEYQKPRMDALNGLKRTTAAEIIRERVERQANQDRPGKTLGERLDAMGETGQAIRQEMIAQAEMCPTPNDAA